MRDAILLIAAVLVVVLIAFEVQRKVRDWRRVRAAAWIGFDVGSQDDLCVKHDGKGYIVTVRSASGTSDDISSGGDA